MSLSFETLRYLISEPFALRALAAGLAVAVMAGVLGCFVVWRGLAYFGDSLAHSAMLGVALGLIAGVGVEIGMVVVGAGFSVLLLVLQARGRLASDAVLGILGHTALAAALVGLAVAERRVNLHAYLFGDILAVGWGQIAWMYGVASGTLVVVGVGWGGLVLMSLSADLARLRGVPVLVYELVFLLLMTLVVAMSVRVVGVLLITALLIVPAATARLLVRTPEAMAGVAVAVAGVAVVGGLGVSLVLDTPAGPSVVLMAAGVFAGVRVWKWRG